MLTFKQMERAGKMFTDAINKHGDDLLSASLEWYTVELVDERMPNGYYQQTLPWVRLAFKW